MARPGVSRVCVGDEVIEEYVDIDAETEALVMAAIDQWDVVAHLRFPNGEARVNQKGRWSPKRTEYACGWIEDGQFRVQLTTRSPSKAFAVAPSLRPVGKVRALCFVAEVKGEVLKVWKGGVWYEPQDLEVDVTQWDGHKNSEERSYEKPFRSD